MSGLKLCKVGGTAAKHLSKLRGLTFGLHYLFNPMPALYCFVVRDSAILGTA